MVGSCESGSLCGRAGPGCRDRGSGSFRTRPCPLTHSLTPCLPVHEYLLRCCIRLTRNARGIHALICAMDVTMAPAFQNQRGAIVQVAYGRHLDSSWHEVGVQ